MTNIGDAYKLKLLFQDTHEGFPNYVAYTQGEDEEM
jgi:hypothetical protein